MTTAPAADISCFETDDRLMRDWRPAIAAALVALALYAVTLGGTYVYDDLFIVGADPRLKDPSRWGEYWTKDYFNGGIDNLYRPLVSMSYAIQWWLHGDRPWAFHLVNWLLHAAASAAVAELARRMAGLRVAYVVGMLFAAHPAHVEAVANVIGRAELACTLAMACAMILFLRRPLTIGRAFAIWACCAAAVLSKEQGLLMPFLLVALELLRRRGWLVARGGDEPPGGRGMTALVLLVTWSFAGYVVFRESILKFWWDPVFLDWTMNPIVHSRGADRWLMPVALLGRYTALLVAPIKLSVDYGGSIIGSHVSPADPYLYLGFATIVAGVFAFVFALRKRSGVAVFSLIALGLSYGIVSNVAIIGTNYGERLMYLPSAFFLMLIALLLVRLPVRTLAGMTVVLLALASVRTVTYAARWNDRLTFYESSLRAQPGSVRLYMLISEEYQRRGDYAAAEQALARGREVEPTYARVWLNSALLAVIQQKYEEASRYAAEAHRLDPRVRNSALERLLADWRATSRPATSRPATTRPARDV